MYELTICGQVYQFNFGMGFLREMNRKISVPVDGMPGVKKNVGLRYAIARVIDGDVEGLQEVLAAANKGMEPRLTMETLDAYIEDSGTDIDALFEQVMDFLKTANATRKEVFALLEAAEEIEAANK